MKIITLPPAARGFDVNKPVRASAAVAAVARGYAFVVRYVRRVQHHDYDLTTAERDAIHAAGLALMVVQHVAPDGWVPTKEMGALYGATAAQECLALGLPPGGTVWCDLEGVLLGTDPAAVIAYCNAWYDEVKRVGFEPGLYVGWHCILTPDQLYHALRFARYWSAYNLHADQYPATRGVQMRQSAAAAGELLPGFTNQTMDVNVVQQDQLGGLPMAWAP